MLGLYGLGFVFATISAALDIFMPRWLAHLVVALALVATAGILAMLGVKRMQRGTPPTPERAIHEAKLTADALKGDGRR